MVKLYRILILAIALAVPCVSHAEYWTGYSLKEMIDASDRSDNGNPTNADHLNHFRLFGFVVGVHDAVEGLTICVPAETKVGQLVAVVKKYYRNNPEKWNMSAAALVEQALSKAFPCKKK